MRKSTPHPCHHCGKMFWVFPSAPQRKFCSRKCYHESGFHSAFMKTHPNSGQIQKGRVSVYKDIICQSCGKKFSVPPSGYNKKSCSRKCSLNDSDRGRKISLAMKGKPKSAEHNQKVSEAIIKHYDKIGRKTYKRSHHTTDKKYIEWKNKVFKRDNFTCQDCDVRSGNGKAVYLQAHHIKSWVKYPRLRYEVKNGITLCVNCHLKNGLHRKSSQDNHNGCINLVQRRRNGKSQKKD